METLHGTYLLFIAIFTAGFTCDGLIINQLSIPKIVEANSKEVILDCDYKVEEWEKNDGFVLKWHRDSVNLVYQWIPPMPPQDIGKLRGRLDMSYMASNDSYEKHRALRIPAPTVDLSGIYSCKVSTFETEQTASAKMMVWAPPKAIQIEQWRPSEHLINFTCIAHDVFPVPDFLLYIIEESGFRRRIKMSNIISHPGSQPGLRRAEGSGLLVYQNINKDTTLGCLVQIPSTTYQNIEEVSFEQDLPVISTTTSKSLPDEEAVKSPAFASGSSRFYLLHNCFRLMLIPCTLTYIYMRDH